MPGNEGFIPFMDDDELDRALAEAARDALIDHKLRGDPIAISENGRVVWIPAEEIVIPDPG